MQLIIDTSDRLMLIVLLGVFICFTYKYNAGLIFISVNSLLVYFFTGYKKLISSLWRNGDAIFIIMNTEIYGKYNIASFVKDKKKLRLIICWSTILFQLTFPLTLFNEYILITYLVLGLFFHLFIAITMKLHNFLYAFISTYPAIYFLSIYFSNWVQGNF